MSNFVNIALDFPPIFSIITNVFIKVHEYSNKIPFISNHKVKVLCLNITLIPSFVC